MNFYKGSQQKYLESFNFSSLTDVVMQLLIFFLLTFSFANTRGINVTLPKAAAGQAPDRKTISVTIAKDKKLTLNGDAIGKGQLTSRIGQLLKKNKEQQVVIRADKDIILQEIIEVFDLAKAAGASRLFIATDSGQEKKQ